MAAPLNTITGDQGKRDVRNSSSSGQFPPSDKTLTYKNTPNSSHTLPHVIKVYSEEFGLRINYESLFKRITTTKKNYINIPKITLTSKHVG